MQHINVSSRVHFSAGGSHSCKGLLFSLFIHLKYHTESDIPNTTMEYYTAVTIVHLRELLLFVLAEWLVARNLPLEGNSLKIVLKWVFRQLL